MFGRNKEAKVWTEDDLFKASMEFLRHGTVPPKEIATVTGVSYFENPPEEIEEVNRTAMEHNAQLAQQRVVEKETQIEQGGFRRALSKAAVVFQSIRS